ncbi:type II secretion system F family protein [Kribbella sp. NPDC051952]|uniref:type II secretion system F family protein n=1 Tax=Kribbella sp. NPDC051952 TaxID=3154851 RepID=UPI00344769AA
MTPTPISDPPTFTSDLPAFIHGPSALVSGLPAPVSGPWAFVSGFLVFLAAALLLPRPGRGLHRLTTPTRDRDPGKPTPHLLSRRRLVVIPPAAAILVAVLGAQFLVSTIAIAVVLALVASQRAHQRRRTVAASRRTQIVEALDVLAAELTAGRPPVDALEGAASISPDFQVAHAAAKLGGDVPGALELAVEEPGATGLRALSAAWRVAEESGAAFAALTERLADSLRADESIHRQTEASLAGARSTARILAALPIFGIALGYGLGAKPLTFLTATPPGWFCLAAGLSLTALGLHWTTNLAKPTT